MFSMGEQPPTTAEMEGQVGTEGETVLVTYRPRLPSVVVFTRTGTARLDEGET
jgi:hypothetical protein